MKIVIAGAGLSGLALAIALQRYDFEVTLVEKRSENSTSEGLFLTITENGLRALEALNCLESVLSKRFYATPLLRFLNSAGRSLGTVSNGWLQNRVPAVTMFHSDLRQALAEEATLRGVRCVDGVSVDSFERRGSGLTIHLSSGESLACAALVGADGVNSTVRHGLGFDDAPVRDTGFCNIGGELQTPWLDATPGEMRMVWGRRSFFGYHCSRAGRAIWFANLPSSVLEQKKARGDVDVSARRRLAAQFENDIDIAARLIHNSEYLRAYPIYDLPPLRRWYAENIVLVGDAAHAVAPSSGQGASLAFEDAVSLSQELASASTVDQAFKRFQAARYERVRRIYLLGRQWSQEKEKQSRLSIAVRDMIMPAVLRFSANDSRMRWIHQYDAAA